jgi:hypothetical protein
MQALGGRKFLMAVVILIVGVAASILQPEAVTTELVALMLGVLATFSAGNALISNAHFKSKAKQPKATSNTKELEAMKRAINEIAAIQESTSNSVLKQQTLLNQYLAGTLQK